MNKDQLMKIKKELLTLLLFGGVFLIPGLFGKTETESKKNVVTYTKDGEIKYYVPNGYHLEGNLAVKDVEYKTFPGFHREGNKYVNNPDGLVDNNYDVPEGYHLEQYEYDENLFYVVQDGYHNENGYKILDGYHLENNKVISDNVVTLKKN